MLKYNRMLIPIPKGRLKKKTPYKHDNYGSMKEPCFDLESFDTRLIRTDINDDRFLLPGQR